MKFKKIFSLAAASIMAASVVATSASADWAPVEGADEGLSVGTANYMVQIFCNVEADDMPMKDYGIDLAKLGFVSFTFQIPEEERDFFNGSFGGGCGISLHASTIEKPAEITDELKTKTAQSGSKYTPWDYYNWMDSANFWGVLDVNAPDPDSYDIDGEYMEGMPTYINYLDPNQTTFLETLGDYTYRVRTKLANPVAEGDCAVEDITDIRVYLQCWNATAFLANVTRTVIYDLDGKPMLAFDGQGKVVDTTADDEKEPVMPEAPPEGEEPAPETSEPASEPVSSEPASEPASTPASEPASSTPAPASSTASESNGLPVGAIIGIIAGVVVVVVIVVVVVVKKKKG